MLITIRINFSKDKNYPNVIFSPVEKYIKYIVAIAILGAIQLKKKIDVIKEYIDFNRDNSFDLYFSTNFIKKFYYKLNFTASRFLKIFL